MKKVLFIIILFLLSYNLFSQSVDIKRQDVYFLGKLEYVIFPKCLSINIGNNEISFSDGRCYYIIDKMKESTHNEKWYKVYRNGIYWVIVIRRDNLSITAEWEGEEMNVFIFKEKIRL